MSWPPQRRSRGTCLCPWADAGLGGEEDVPREHIRRRGRVVCPWITGAGPFQQGAVSLRKEVVVNCGPLLPVSVEQARGDNVDRRRVAALRLTRLSKPFSSQPSQDASVFDSQKKEVRTWADFWVEVAMSLGSACGVFVKLEGSCMLRSSIMEPLLTKAAGTLRRPVAGWRLWSEHCTSINVIAGAPSVAAACDFMWALRAGSKLDRGRRRRAGANGVVKAIRFVARELSVQVLFDVFSDKTVLAVAKGQAAGPLRPPREATPLTLYFMASMEARVVCLYGSVGANNEELYQLCVMLIMAWTSLRWSDAQRTRLDSISLDQGVLRGRCWQTKSALTGMPWACVGCGFMGSNWGEIARESIQRKLRLNPEQDCLLVHCGTPMKYATGLNLLRSHIGGLGGGDLADVLEYSCHSLKRTLLSWARQLRRSFDERSAQGHLRETGQRGVVKTYSDDDVAAALVLRHAIVLAASQGWRPLRARGRGSEAPLVERLSFAGKMVAPPRYEWLPRDMLPAVPDDLDSCELMDDQLSVSEAAESDGEEPLDVDEPDDAEPVDLFDGEEAEVVQDNRPRSLAFDEPAEAAEEMCAPSTPATQPPSRSGSEERTPSRGRAGRSRSRAFSPRQASERDVARVERSANFFDEVERRRKRQKEFARRTSADK